MKKDSYHHKNLKKALIDEATRRLDADPESEISLRGLARDLGVSAMAPYAHFQSKAELLDAVAVNGHMVFREAFQRVAEATLGLEDRLVAYCECYLSFSREHPGQFHIMFGLKLREEDDPVRLAGEANLAIVRNSIAEDLPAADEAGLTVITDLLYSVVHGVAVLSANDVLRSLYLEDFGSVDLIREAVEALVRKFQTSGGT
ncbi:TetR/AcrR family transcriptional regulator [Tropicimonas marinistellae]|uniref:TetR/AcrR family transcriptional regulator n=1 Tax=Tropicimonas marinistellae TaxID=1739787 RepID=UPI000829BEE4|nr:TetR/AcrR family transcriptional regulator [Tropicimonas marinistellae]